MNVFCQEEKQNQQMPNAYSEKCVVLLQIPINTNANDFALKLEI
jgi:hypothetical protein